MTRGVKRWSDDSALAHLLMLPDAHRLTLARLLVPDGYAISPPRREELIARMEKLLEIYAGRPTQYGPYAVRPQDEVQQ